MACAAGPDKITLRSDEREKIVHENGLKKFRGSPALDELDVENLRCEFFRRYAVLGRTIARVEIMKGNNNRSLWRFVKHQTPAQVVGDDGPPPIGADDTDPPAAVEQETTAEPDEPLPGPGPDPGEPSTVRSGPQVPDRDHGAPTSSARSPAPFFSSESLNGQPHCGWCGH